MLYEMAILNEDNDIAYEKDFEEDVLGYLNEHEVEKYLKVVENY